MQANEMTWEEVEVEAARLDVLIKASSAKGIAAVAEMAKHPLTLDQMRVQIIRQQMGGLHPKTEAQIQAQIKAEGLDPDRPFDPVRNGGLCIPDTASEADRLLNENQ